MQTLQRMTVADFDTWVTQTGNTDQNYEYIAGEAVAVVSNNYCSQVAMLIGAFITVHVRANGLGHVTGADGGYAVNGERYIPDVGFIRKSRQPEPSREAYNPNTPDLAVEVVSPTDAEKQLTVKLSNYLAAGTTVWIVYPDEREVHVHTGQGAQVINETGILDGGSLLTGLTLPVNQIFPEENTA